MCLEFYLLYGYKEYSWTVTKGLCYDEYSEKVMVIRIIMFVMVKVILKLTIKKCIDKYDSNMDTDYIYPSVSMCAYIYI